MPDVLCVPGTALVASSDVECGGVALRHGSLENQCRQTVQEDQERRAFDASGDAAAFEAMAASEVGPSVPDGVAAQGLKENEFAGCVRNGIEGCPKPIYTGVDTTSF